MKNIIDHSIDKPEELKLGYIIIQIDLNRYDKIQELTSKIVSIMDDKEAIIKGMSPYISAVFANILGRDINIETNLKEAVDLIVKRFKKDIRVVYGLTKGIFPLIEGNQVFDYAPLIHNMEKRREKLFSLEYGEAVEIN